MNWPLDRTTNCWQDRIFWRWDDPDRQTSSLEIQPLCIVSTTIQVSATAAWRTEDKRPKSRTARDDSRQFCFDVRRRRPTDRHSIIKANLPPLLQHERDPNPSAPLPMTVVDVS
jgi:hypothetical protein